jgi:di/tricarboxylate transporter
MPKSRHYSGKYVRLGYQTSLLILSAGGYKFSDFLRVGIPLAIIMWVDFSVVLPLLYDI